MRVTCVKSEATTSLTTGGFVTPAQRHAGMDSALLEHRAIVYERARHKHLERWSRLSRQWAYVDTVHLNPDTPISKEAEHSRK